MGLDFACDITIFNPCFPEYNNWIKVYTMITITENLKTRIARERDSQGTVGLCLRVAVTSGGCSGFQYQYTWDTKAPSADDATYGDDMVVIDETSLPFLRDATIDFVKTLMGEDFKVTNPHTTSGCGCGQSFAV